MDGIMKYIIVNTKNKLSNDAAKKYNEGLKELDFSNIKFIMCPSDGNINIFENMPYSLGAQNAGDISLLNEYSVSHCIVGHSSKRMQGLSNHDIIKETCILQENEIKPILCVGEDVEGDDINDVIIKDIKPIFDHLDNTAYILIAYEPVWSVGKGIYPNIDYIENNITTIKNYLLDNYEVNVKVVYGGSVSLENINILKDSDLVDGVMISSNALDTTNLKKIVEYIKE